MRSLRCAARPGGGHLDQRLVIVSGKGGVGKSSVSAALALSSARAGLRTLVCEVNTDERVTGLLGHGPVGPEVRRLEENLWAVDVRPAEAMKEYALMTLRFERVYRAVFENRLVRYFLRFIPSLQELVMLGKVLYSVKEGAEGGRLHFDRVVLDAPATGHALAFLGVPQVLLDTVPPGPLASDLTWMRDLLVDPATTAAVLVSLPEEMPVNETLELSHGLRERLHIPVAAVVLNAFDPPRYGPEELLALEATPALLARVRAYEARAGMSRLAAEQLAPAAPRLVCVPRLYRPAFDRQAVLAMAEALAPLAEEKTP